MRLLTGCIGADGREQEMRSADDIAEVEFDCAIVRSCCMMVTGRMCSLGLTCLPWLNLARCPSGRRWYRDSIRLQQVLLLEAEEVEVKEWVRAAEIAFTAMLIAERYGFVNNVRFHRVHPSKSHQQLVAHSQHPSEPWVILPCLIHQSLSHHLLIYAKVD